MKERLKYAPLAVAGVIIDACLLVGAFFTYLPFGKLKSGSYFGATASATNESYQMFMYIFMFGIAALVTCAVLKILYYFMREKKAAVLISVGIGIFGIILMLLFIRSLLSTFTGAFGMYGGYGALSAYNDLMNMAFVMLIGVIMSLLVLIFDLFVLLSMKKVFKSQKFAKMVPNLKKYEMGRSQKPIMMPILSAIIFSVMTVIVLFRLTGNPFGLINNILTWAVLLLAGMAGILVAAVMFHSYYRNQLRIRPILISVILNYAIFAFAILGMLFNFAKSYNSGQIFYIIMLVCTIGNIIFQIITILGIKGKIKARAFADLSQMVAMGAAAYTYAENNEKAIKAYAIGGENGPAISIGGEPIEPKEEEASETEISETEALQAEAADSVETETADSVETEAATATSQTGADTAETAPIQVYVGDTGEGNREEKSGFFKTKNRKIAIIAAIVIAVAIIGVVIWNVFFAKTEIDAFKQVEVTFEGDDSSGYAYVDNTNVTSDINDPQIANFMNVVSYDVENNGMLKNGDKVTVTLNYSQQMADSLGIKFKEESKEFEVSGLTKKYQSAKEIDPEVYDKAYKMAMKEAKESTASKESEYYKSYFIVENTDLSLQDNKIAFVFQETYEDYDLETMQTVDKKRYGVYFCSFDSSFDPEDAYMLKIVLKNHDTYKEVTEESRIIPELKEEFSYGGLSADDITVEEVHISM